MASKYKSTPRIYSTKEEALQALRLASGTNKEALEAWRLLYGTNKSHNNKSHIDNIWFIRVEPKKAMYKDELHWYENLIAWPLYWLWCLIDERKKAKKWPWNEKVQKPKANPSAGLFVLGGFFSGTFALDRDLMRGSVKYVLIGAVVFLAIHVSLAIWSRASKFRAVNSKLSKIKTLVSGEISTSYRTPGSEPAAFGEIRNIIGENL